MLLQSDATKTNLNKGYDVIMFSDPFGRCVVLTLSTVLNDHTHFSLNQLSAVPLKSVAITMHCFQM